MMSVPPIILQPDHIIMGKNQIREIQDHDIPDVIELWRSCGLIKPWNNPSADIALARRNPNSTVLVLFSDNHLCATAMVGEDGHRGWIYYVAADQSMRGQGLGREIVTAAEEWLVKRDIPKVNLLVRQENQSAVQFYEQLGFVDAGNVCLEKALVSNSG